MNARLQNRNGVWLFHVNDVSINDQTYLINSCKRIGNHFNMGPYEESKDNQSFTVGFMYQFEGYILEICTNFCDYHQIELDIE